MSVYATWDANLHLASDEPDGYPDTQMVPFVEHLRARGIVTFQSCQGHPGECDGCLWVQAAFEDQEMRDLVATGVFTHVKRMYLPCDCDEFVWIPERTERALEVLDSALTDRMNAWGDAYDNRPHAVSTRGDPTCEASPS